MKQFYENVVASFKNNPEPYSFKTPYGARTLNTPAYQEEDNHTISLESYMDVVYGSEEYLIICYGDDAIC